jgi:hypothetical protein
MGRVVKAKPARVAGFVDGGGVRKGHKEQLFAALSAVYPSHEERHAFSAVPPHVFDAVHVSNYVVQNTDITVSRLKTLILLLYS